LSVDGVHPNPLHAATHLLDRFLALNDKTKLEELKPGLWNRMEEARTGNTNAWTLEAELFLTLNSQERFLLFF